MIKLSGWQFEVLSAAVCQRLCTERAGCDVSAWGGVRHRPGRLGSCQKCHLRHSFIHIWLYIYIHIISLYIHIYIYATKFFHPSVHPLPKRFLSKCFCGFLSGLTNVCFLKSTNGPVQFKDNPGVVASMACCRAGEDWTSLYWHMNFCTVSGYMYVYIYIYCNISYIYTYIYIYIHVHTYTYIRITYDAIYIYTHMFHINLAFIEFQPLQRHRIPSVLNWCVMQTFTQTTPCHLNQAWLLDPSKSLKKSWDLHFWRKNYLFKNMVIMFGPCESWEVEVNWICQSQVSRAKGSFIHE